MKLVFLSVASAPSRYSFDGEKIIATNGKESKEYDLANFPDDGIFMGAEDAGGADALRNVERVAGVLTVTLTQQVIAGQYPGRKAHWRESPIIDADDYDPNKCYVIPTGMAGVDDYEIVQGVDVAGNTGWTVRKKETADG